MQKNETEKNKIKERGEGVRERAKRCEMEAEERDGELGKRGTERERDGVE